MQLAVKRLDDRRYETLITRSDGVRYLVKGVGHMGTIPHDLAHFVVETALEIRQGFWGSVAAGGLFTSLAHVDGRRRPHAERRSAEVLRNNKGIMTEVEILVGLFDKAFGHGLSPESGTLKKLLRDYTWTPLGGRKRMFSDGEIRAVAESWKEMRTAWNGLEVGGTLELTWPL